MFIIRLKQSLGFLLTIALLGLISCGQSEIKEEKGGTIKALEQKGLKPEIISAKNFVEGKAPANFEKIAGAAYKPSGNEEPEIPAQCWIQTNYGSQNACKYCHTDYLATIEHGNAFPISDDQILYSFPSPELNNILWQNVIYPQNIEERLRQEGIEIPSLEDIDYVRQDNWQTAFLKARSNGSEAWLNTESRDENFALFPALNPKHLFPYKVENPTSDGKHGYIDKEGFVRNEKEEYTGWRAVNFFPYTVFTPLTGSVSGIYIRLPKEFMSNNKTRDIEIYKKNLELLEKNIKNKFYEKKSYYGDADHIAVKKGFYPKGTEFAHPLHYVDLNADGESGTNADGFTNSGKPSYEFPGTRSKRIKEMRYMYKWKDVTLSDIDGESDEIFGEDDGFGKYVGREGQGWIDNGAGWILAAFIENRDGELRPQTTEELAQCLGCHSKVGNTVDAVWSFQRKLPGAEGWAEMNYGHYKSETPEKTKLQDYLYESSGMGELGYFYYTVVGADLYGVMPAEIESELRRYANNIDLKSELDIAYSIDEFLDDEILKQMKKPERKPRLLARQKLMRHYADNKNYLYYDANDDKYYIKGSIFYPTPSTMKANIQAYRKIVLDQSYNLGKDVFGTESEHVPFTFRSDGSVKDKDGNLIPAGEIIYSRPYNEEGEGYTPTGIVKVNEHGEVLDTEGKPTDPIKNSEKVDGHISTGGTYDIFYNPILSGLPVRK